MYKFRSGSKLNLKNITHWLTWSDCNFWNTKKKPHIDVIPSIVESGNREKHIQQVMHVIDTDNSLMFKWFFNNK